MSLFKGLKKLKTRLSSSKSHGSDPSTTKGKQGSSHSPTPSPSAPGRKNDTTELFQYDHAVASESTFPVSTPSPDLKAKIDDNAPTIAEDEAPASRTIASPSAGSTKRRQQTSLHIHTALLPNQSQESGPPKRRFVRSKSPQQDIAILHVAYIMQDSTELQELILEIVRISDELEDVLKAAVSFTTDLIAALDVKPIHDGANEAVSSFLVTMKSIDLNESPDQALRIVQQAIDEIERAYPVVVVGHQKNSDNFSTIASDVLGIALPFFDILKDASTLTPVPMVQPLIAVVAGFLKAANEASNNFEWMRWLAATAAEYVVRVAVICPREIDSRWTEAIESLDRRLSKIVEDAQGFSRRSIVSRFLSHGGDAGEISRMKDNLRAAIDLFNMEIQINIKIDLDNMSRNIESLLLENLPRLPSHKISQDRYFRASRDQEIFETLGWVEANHSERFLWIHGAAGVGKSTYARRLLDHIKEEGMLGAFAYFAIGIDSDPKDLVRMMARELASLHPGCRHDVVRAIKECSGVHQGLDEYITHYLVRPISSLSYCGPLVIILDALDEWAYRAEFLTALVQKVHFPGTTALKFVMTSRYSMEIGLIVSDDAHIRELTPVSVTICREYFEERFHTINWYGHDPDSYKIDKLVELADGLLIWAATVFTLVSVKRPNKRPNQILDDILASSSSVARGKRMEELYGLAMERIFPDEDEEVKQSRSDVLLSMAALKEPLPLAEFALLVDVLPEFVNDICIGLRALQTRGVFDESMVQPAIKIFHASFIDHFGPLQEARAVIARHCVSFFERSLNTGVSADMGANLFRQAELYIGKHFVYHILESPTDLQTQTIAGIPSDHLRMWTGWSLAHLMIIGEENGLPAGSHALQTLAESLLDGSGIIYSPELMTRNQGQLSSFIFAFQKVLELAGIDWDNSRSADSLQELILYQNDARRWVHIINIISIGFLLSQQVRRDKAHRLNITMLELTIAHLKGISETFDTGCPLSVLENLALALEERFKYNGTIEDLERAIILHTMVQERMFKGAPGYTTVLNNFGKAHHTRFQHAGSRMDLDRSISLLQEALAHDAFTHHKRPTILDNLGLALHTRYLLRGLDESSTGIDEVVKLHQEAFALRSKHSSHSPLLLNNLSSAMQSKYEQAKDPYILETAFFHALQAASVEHLGNLEQSMYTATLARSLHLISLARLDPCSNVPQEHLHLSKTNMFVEIDSFEHPSLRHLDYAAVARDYYRDASNILPLTAPSRWSILSQLGLAQQARATMNDELDLRYADEAIFLHHLIKHRHHASHPTRILSEKYLQQAYETLQRYNIPRPDHDVFLEQAMVQGPEKIYTSEGRHCGDESSEMLYNTQFIHRLRNYVKDSGEPVVLYRFSSGAIDEICRPCGGGDVNSDIESVINGVSSKEDMLETIPVLWNLLCSAKYLAIRGLPEKVLSEGPIRLSGCTYHDIAVCFEKWKPQEFEHQFIYVKDGDHAMIKQDVPINELASPELVGGELVKNPLEFAVIFYLASLYHAVPTLKILAGVISKHQYDESEATDRVAEALVEVVLLISSKKESVLTLLDSCSGVVEKLGANAGNREVILTEMATSLREGIDTLKGDSLSSRPRLSDLVLDVERFLQYPANALAFSDIFHRSQTMASISLVQPLLNILFGVCDRYFRSTTRLEEEIYFIMVVILAQLSSGIAFVLSDGRHPLDGRLYHATRELSESLQNMLRQSQIVDDLATPFRALIHNFRYRVYDRSQLGRTYILCMACHSIRLWDRGWANRWYYAKITEKSQSTYSTESGFMLNYEEEITAGGEMRLKIKMNLRLGARHKLKTAQPVQLKQKQPKVKEDDEQGGAPPHSTPPFDWLTGPPDDEQRAATPLDMNAPPPSWPTYPVDYTPEPVYRISSAMGHNEFATGMLNALDFPSPNSAWAGVRRTLSNASSDNVAIEPPSRSPSSFGAPDDDGNTRLVSLNHSPPSPARF